MTFNIITGDGTIDRVDCQSVQMGPDGSLICGNGPNFPPVRVYNPRWWRSFEPSMIQSGSLNS